MEEPVSKMTVKFCGGEPMEMVPKYSICRPGQEGSQLWLLGRGRDPRGAPWEGLGQHRPGLRDLGSDHQR